MKVIVVYIPFGTTLQTTELSLPFGQKRSCRCFAPYGATNGQKRSCRCPLLYPLRFALPRMGQRTSVAPLVQQQLCCCLCFAPDGATKGNSLSSLRGVFCPEGNSFPFGDANRRGAVCAPKGTTEGKALAPSFTLPLWFAVCSPFGGKRRAKLYPLRFISPRGGKQRAR